MLNHNHPFSHTVLAANSLIPRYANSYYSTVSLLPNVPKQVIRATAYTTAATLLPSRSGSNRTSMRPTSKLFVLLHAESACAGAGARLSRLWISPAGIKSVRDRSRRRWGGLHCRCRCLRWRRRLRCWSWVWCRPRFVRSPGVHTTHCRHIRYRRRLRGFRGWCWSRCGLGQVKSGIVDWWRRFGHRWR